MSPLPPRVLPPFLLAVAARRARLASFCSAATAAMGAAAAHRIGRQVGPALGTAAAPAPAAAAMGAASGSSDATDSERLRPATDASSTAGHSRWGTTSARIAPSAATAAADSQAHLSGVLPSDAIRCSPLLI